MMNTEDSFQDALQIIVQVNSLLEDNPEYREIFDRLDDAIDELEEKGPGSKNLDDPLNDIVSVASDLEENDRLDLKDQLMEAVDQIDEIHRGPSTNDRENNQSTPTDQLLRPTESETIHFGGPNL